jgi:two-component system OmpR family response regulator
MTPAARPTSGGQSTDAPAEALELPDTRPSSSGEGRGPWYQHRARLLLVEDDQRLGQMLASGIKDEGYQYELTASGTAALRELQSGRYDACVLDLQLPDLDGLVVLAQAREARVRTPILILTARDGVADRVQGLNAGADDYLTKPFAFAELVARLRVLLRRATPHVGGKLRLGPLELDPVAHTVRAGNERIELSQKQFALLEFLLRHRGQVLTRATLLSRVFSYDFDPGTNLVDVHVAQLRRKLEPCGAAGFIHTIRGVGYRAGDESDD